jgi:hypothetical protein
MVAARPGARLIAATTVVTFVFVGAVARVPEPSTPKVGFSIKGPMTGPAPFRGTTEPNVAAAEALLGVRIPRPHTLYANDRTAWSVVVDRRNRVVAITYGPSPGSGAFEPQPVQIVADFRGRFYATEAGYLRRARAEVRAMGAVTSLITVHGIPAIYFQGNYPGDCGHPAPGQQGCAPAQNNPAAIEMQFGHSNLELYGPPDWGLWEMWTLASTIR